MQIVAWAAFVLAAVFEVGGDAVIRIGIKNNNIVVMVFGALILAGYGLIVNSLDWDFSAILGVYVAVFALAGVLFGRFVFRESVPFATWLGLGFIIVGGVIVQCGINQS
jgi:drug/metabolite transporter superfamily protein YnfA